jgi:alpha-beta hydrolase superfamily lysophospholipase
MTEALMWKRFSEKARAEILNKGLYLEPSQYGGAYEITAGLIADGRKHSILGQTTDLACPVRILQGTSDPDVPADHAAATFASLRGEDVTLTYIKDGDHRLSRPGDLRLFAETSLSLAQRADGL